MAFDEVSSPVLAKKLSSPDFNPEEYVKSLVTKYDIYRSLLDHKNDIQKLGEETAVSLKKNVYRNYRQFIDTSKEISYLEAEMYQLSHLFTEQKSILADQLENSIFERPKGLPVPKDPAKEAYKAKKKNFLNNIEANKHMIAELSTKELLLDGELTEFDPETYSPVQKIGAFLLTDNLLITSLPGDRPGSAKYVFLTMFDLSDLAVVNVRDGQGIKNAFKILYSLDSRMFCAPTKDEKLAWLDQIDKAKKNYKKGVQVDAQKLVDFQVSQNEEDDAEEDALPNADRETDPIMYPNLLDVDWLLELPEDLDMSIAQRDFESAVKFVEKGLAYLRDFPESPSLTSIRGKIESRVQNLTTILEKALDNSQSSRHVSLRSIRVYVQLLIRLGRSKLACELFLRNRTFEIKNSFKQIKMEGATALFINKLANVFFTAIIETGKEYKKIFPKNANCSAFIVWSHNELQQFVDKFARQVFSRNVDLSAIAVCITIALDACKRLEVIGMDLTFDLQHMLLQQTVEAVFDSRDQLLERVRHHGMEDDWKGLTFEGNNDGLGNTQAELSSLGVDVKAYIQGNKLMLSHSTVFFAKSVLGFLQDCMKIYSGELHATITQCLQEIFKAEAMQLEAIIRLDEYKSKVEFIAKNVEFLSTKIVQVTRDQIEERVGHSVAMLQEVTDAYSKLRRLCVTRKVK